MAQVGCPEINVKLTVRNELQPQFFTYDVIVTDTRGAPLIRFLEKGADKDNHFRFASTYYPDLGYFINSMNGLVADYDADKTYWQILDSNDQPLKLGVSSYIPVNEEHVTFNFRRGTGTDCLFASTYFPDLGYFINSMNGLVADYDADKTYWQILDSNDQPLKLGVSSYIPVNKEHVTFNLRKDTGTDCL